MRLQPVGNAVVVEPLESRTLFAAAAADPVLAWNEVLLDAVRADRTPPPAAARDMAIVHIAIDDAVNAIDPTHASYASRTKARGNASAPAAVAAAAHRTLVALFPAQSATFDAALAASLAGIPDGQFERKGVEVGRASADKILAARRDDGSADVVIYQRGTEPGDWQPTPPAFQQQPALPRWPGVTPFAIEDAAQFRPDGPPALTSGEYARAFDEVKALGSRDSTARTPEQTTIAMFWADGAGTATPPGHWNEIAQDVATARQNSLSQNARLFALLNIALADAGISCWDCKYDFDFWRPVTGIRAADSDGNPATVADPAWTPLLVTPPFPAYTSGHSTFSSAAAAVLGRFFGTDRVSFTTTDDDTPGIVRSFTSFSQAAAEAGQSRIYGGIHWQFDNQDGQQAGRAIGNYVADHVLTSQTHGKSIRGNGPPVVVPPKGPHGGVLPARLFSDDLLGDPSDEP
jgi:hypothetical protein